MLDYNNCTKIEIIIIHNFKWLDFNSLVCLYIQCTFYDKWDELAKLRLRADLTLVEPLVLASYTPEH